MSVNNNEFVRFLSTFHYFPSVSLYEQKLVTCSYFCLTLFWETLSTSEHTQFILKFLTKNGEGEVVLICNIADVSKTLLQLCFAIFP